MDVVAYLPPHLSRALQLALGDAHVVREVDGWAALRRTVRRDGAGLVVADPTLDDDGGAAIAALARRHESLPVVVYTALTGPAAEAIAALPAGGVREVVLHEYDDAAPQLREVVERQPGALLGAQLATRLAPELDRLPDALAAAVRRMLSRPGGAENASELGARAEMPRRTLYRTFEAAGLASPSVLVRAARLLHAYAYLRDDAQRAGDVVDRLGYSSRQLFWRHVWETFGMRPSELRRDMDPEEFIRRLVLVVRTPGAAGAADPDDVGHGAD